MDDRPQLKQELRHFQVLFIALSAIIGGGIFNNNGEALELSGPNGLIVAVIAMSAIAIMFSECISELVQKFPAPNAIVEYIRVFVDEDLAWVVGIAYWYTFSSIFAVQNLAAANLSRYWGLSQVWQTLAFYFLAPVMVVAINVCGVFTFGWIETVGGALKVCLVLGVSFTLYTIAGKDHLGGSGDPINDGFQNNEVFIGNDYRAVCYAIPLVAYSMLGLEIFAVTAFETKYRKDLSWPPRILVYVVFILYLMCTIGEALAVRWTDSHLPKIYGGTVNDAATSDLQTEPTSSNIAIIAAWAAGYHKFAGFLNACFIFSVLSASNTTLYVASRTLYGMTRLMPNNRLGKKVKTLSFIWRPTSVPIAALVVSAGAFCWLPFLQLRSNYSISSLIEIIAISASVSCLVVWAALCLAFIRYYFWLERHKDTLKLQYREYYRKSKEYKATTLLGWSQPLPAFLGLFGCLVVFAFTTATWWDKPISFAKTAEALGAHIVLFVLFIVFKAINRRGWVNTNTDTDTLIRQLNRLQYLKQDEQKSEEELQSQARAQHPRFDTTP